MKQGWDSPISPLNDILCARTKTESHIFITNSKLSRGEFCVEKFIPPVSGASQGNYFLPKSHKLAVFWRNKQWLNCRKWNFLIAYFFLQGLLRAGDIDCNLCWKIKMKNKQIKPSLSAMCCKANRLIYM